MTGRTHDLAAFTALNIVFVSIPVGPMTPATLVAAIGANMIGGLLPDIDDATADIWDKVRWGNIVGKIIKPLTGGHRMISHSLVGMFLIGYILNIFLTGIQAIIVVDMQVVWWATMIGYFSHLVTDSLTTQGVPWLFPIPFRFGFPPLRFSRIKTGGFREKYVFFPSLLLINCYLVYTFYPVYASFLKNYLT